MSDLNKKKKEVSEVFNKYLESQVSPNELAQKIDEAIFELVRYKLTDPDFTGHEGGYDSIFFLKDIKDICTGEYVLASWI